MKKDCICYGDSVYRITLHRKFDYKGPLSQTSEFFYDSRIPSSLKDDNEFAVIVTGAELSLMIEDIHSAFARTMYISRVEYAGEIAVYSSKS